MTTTNMPDEFWNPRARFYPLVLSDGRWNVAPLANWIEDGITEPGPPAGRGLLLFGDAVYADLVTWHAMLQQRADEAQRAVQETLDRIEWPRAN